MVGKNDVFPHDPRIGFMPLLDQEIVKLRIGEDFFPVVGTDRDENDNALIPLR